nr:DnaB-like helicase N-terminal domain-containing protein [Streptomyces kaniharaensis]
MKPLLRAEQAVLGAVLLDPGQLAALSWLAPDHFYRPVHRALSTTEEVPS